MPNELGGLEGNGARVVCTFHDLQYFDYGADADDIRQRPTIILHTFLKVRF